MDLQEIILVDCASLHFASKYSNEYKLDIAKAAEYFRNLSDNVAEDNGMPTFTHSVLKVFSTCDEQKPTYSMTKFRELWEAAGFEFIGIDYRLSVPSAAPGSKPHGFDTITMSTLMAYELAKATQNCQTGVVTIVTHAMDIAIPLMDVVNSHDYKAVLCGFKQVTDRRWGRVFEREPNIVFDDLTEALDLVSIKSTFKSSF
jgi:hypothetical protein